MVASLPCGCAAWRSPQLETLYKFHACECLLGGWPRKRVPPAGLEPATERLEGSCSIQLSYEGWPVLVWAAARVKY